MWRSVPVKPKNFAEDENEDHADIDPGLLHIGTDSLHLLLDVELRVQVHRLQHLPRFRWCTQQLHLQDRLTTLTQGACSLFIGN